MVSRNALAGNTPTGMGGSTAGEAAEALRYYPIWQQELADGSTELQFRDWLEQEYYPRQQMNPSVTTGVRG